jgi:putative flippase GtrA
VSPPLEARAGKTGMQEAGARENLLLRLARRAPSGQLLRFGVVGVAATLVHLGTLRLGVERAGIPPAIANGIAFSTAVGVTYLGQALWVFHRFDHSLARFRRFAVSVLGGLLANVGIMAFAVQILGLHYLAGFVAALILVPAGTFVVNKFWVFS